MKISHLNKELENYSLSERLKIAKDAESEREYKKAIQTYEYVVKKFPLNEFAYQRLMIIFRQQKEYKDELRIINTALANFKEVYQQKKLHAENSKVSKLSRLLMKSTGLTDKKGKSFYLPEPLNRWMKRKEAVEKIMRKKNKR